MLVRLLYYGLSVILFILFVICFKKLSVKIGFIETNRRMEITCSLSSFCNC